MIDQFNQLAINFLTSMENTFPNETKIKVYKQQYMILQSMNNKKPLEMFIESIADYGDQILSRDENFFKQENFVNKAESISGKMGLIKYWDSMNIQTKNNIWEYIQGLYILGMGSLDRQNELQTVIKRTNFTG